MIIASDNISVNLWTTNRMEDPVNVGMLNLRLDDKVADSPLLPVYALTPLSAVGFWAWTVVDMYFTPHRLKGG